MCSFRHGHLHSIALLMHDLTFFFSKKYVDINDTEQPGMKKYLMQVQM